MKEKFISALMAYIKKYNNYSESKLEEIKYGLEGLYLTITKLVFIVTVAYILNILSEVLIFLIFYNIVRSTSFGLHATKSWMCLVSSLIIFITMPLVSKYIIIPNYIKIISSFLLIIEYYKNAPADTYKRPIVNLTRRKIYKLLSVTIVFIYSLLSLIIKDNFISNSLIISALVQAFIISPYTYRFFKLPYDNYKTYVKEKMV